MEAKVNLTGGCGGHFGEDDRCYCDSADVNVKFYCPKAEHWERVGEWPNVKTRRVKNPCKQQPLSIGELSDQFSIARWFTENYVPTPGKPIY